MQGYPGVYILSNRRNGTLYTGATSDLVRRIHAHRAGYVDGFSKRYGLKRLVYFEACESTHQAFMRERQIKGLLRRKKIALIDSVNPSWEDLFTRLLADQAARVGVGGQSC
ncbi:GIY-YIG nuclease family protein [Spongiibacter taiwanensis]|uniref:GIY-YIG nuclease family protein n=1 Tax=Spongiibacter taiwanensis TaxID=1748242 RepID=UPI002035FB08|nr:GIY-YIG nuclease family protein [Spongiibacter taiwanensis]USA42131.1 GIY-YIG nuclease family protein [Spongiibacter taiwanensis]